MISEDTMTYRCAAALAILFNMLASAIFIAQANTVGYVSYLPVAVAFNLFSYLVLIGALRTSRPERTGRMAAMAMNYRGAAKIRLDDGLTVDVTVSLTTEQDEYLSSWGGRGTTSDLRVMNVGSGKLVLPDGAEGDVFVANAQMSSERPGVLLHLQGSGPAPY